MLSLLKRTGCSKGFQFLDELRHGTVCKIPQLVIIQIRECICRSLFHDPQRAFVFGVFKLGAEICFEFFEPRRVLSAQIFKVTTAQGVFFRDSSQNIKDVMQILGCFPVVAAT